MAALSSLAISHSVIAIAVAMRRGWPARQRDDGFLALLGKDSDLDLAITNVKDGIWQVPLRKDELINLKFGDSSTPIFSGEKGFGIEWGLFLHSKVPEPIPTPSKLDNGFADATR
jgi:hypothetical protein